MGSKPKEGVLKDIMDKAKADQKAKTMRSKSMEKNERTRSFSESVKSSLVPLSDLQRNSISETEIEIVTARYGDSIMSIRSVAHPTSYLETTIHVLKGNVGAGLLAMGDVLKNSGIVFGPVMLITMGIICTYCIHLLLVCANKCAVKWRLPIDPTFAETIELSFKLGPKIFKRMSQLAKNLLICALIGTQLGFCSVYYLIIGKAVGRYFELLGISYDIRVYLCMIYPVILAMALIRNLKFLAPLSLIANIFILTAVTMVLIVACQDLPNITEREVLRPIERWPFAFGTTIFAYEGINLVIPLRNEMKTPSSFQSVFGVLNVSMTMIILLYTGFGLISYWKYGNDIMGNVSTNLPEGHWTTMISDGSVFVALLFSYPLQFHVAFKVIFELLVEKFGACMEMGKRMLVLELIVRFILVTLTCLFAMFIPHLSLVISLVGAMCSSWLAILLPVLAHVSLYSPWSKNHKDDNVNKCSYICKMWFVLLLNIICLFVGIAGFILGTYVATVDLISKINEDYIAHSPHL